MVIERFGLTYRGACGTPRALPLGMLRVVEADRRIGWHGEASLLPKRDESNGLAAQPISGDSRIGLLRSLDPLGCGAPRG